MRKEQVLITSVSSSDHSYLQFTFDFMTFTQNINISYFEHKRKSYLTNFSVELRSKLLSPCPDLDLDLKRDLEWELELIKTRYPFNHHSLIHLFVFHFCFAL